MNSSRRPSLTRTSDPVAPRRLEGLKLVVMVPCLNEEPTVGDVVSRVPRQLPGIREVEVLVVDDGSTDATAERAREAGATVLNLGRNLGLGMAFRAGVQRCLVSGAGNVAQFITEKLIDLGAVVITMSDSSGFIHDPDGITAENLKWITDLKNVRRGRIEEYAEAHAGAEFTGGWRLRRGGVSCGFCRRRAATGCR